MTDSCAVPKELRQAGIRATEATETTLVVGRRRRVRMSCRCPPWVLLAYRTRAVAAVSLPWGEANEGPAQPDPRRAARRRRGVAPGAPEPTTSRQRPADAQLGSHRLAEPGPGGGAGWVARGPSCGSAWSPKVARSTWRMVPASSRPSPRPRVIASGSSFAALVLRAGPPPAGDGFWALARRTPLAAPPLTRGTRLTGPHPCCGLAAPGSPRLPRSALPHPGVPARDTFHAARVPDPRPSPQTAGS